MSYLVCFVWNSLLVNFCTRGLSITRYTISDILYELQTAGRVGEVMIYMELLSQDVLSANVYIFLVKNDVTLSLSSDCRDFAAEVFLCEV